MRTIFSEKFKFESWRKIWVALAQTQYEAGLLSKKELNDLKKNQNHIDIERILEIEKETKHDVVAAIKEFAEKSKIGGGKIHLGATSMDIVDNADAIRIHLALKIILLKTKHILELFSEQIKKYARLTCIGYTHLQPAEPTTVGYRLAFYAQDILTSFEFLSFAEKNFKAKGMKGAVGTAASYHSLLEGKGMDPSDFEKKVMKKIGMDAVLISTQVYPRQFDFIVLSSLSSLSLSFHKFAADLRLLQSPTIGEWSEPFGKKQVGSSAMPFKKNPINSEKICSLARYVSTLPKITWENAAHSYLERTLDDSANKRIIIAESFLAMDEILNTAEKIIKGLVINTEKIEFNLKQYSPFAATEGILIALVKKGADRQKMHELLREISLAAWSGIQKGKTNPMILMIKNHKEVVKYLKEKDLEELINIENHVGDAPERALQLIKKIKSLK